MKTRMNGIKAALLALAAVLLLAGCSNMIELLRLYPLNIVSTAMPYPSNVISVVVTDEIPPGAVPTVTYTLPDGTKVTVKGTLADNGDGTTTLSFDLNPVPQGLPGGTLPIVIEVDGYAPTSTTVTYTPPVSVSVKSGGKEYTDEDDDGVIDDEISIPQKGGTIEKPDVITNYREEDIVIDETYTDEYGNPIPDLNGDGVTDWEDIQRWLTKDDDDDGIPDNAEKPVTVTVTATPKEDTSPSSKKTISYTIKSGSALTVQITVSTTVFTLTSAQTGSNVTFTVTTTLESPTFSWLVNGTVQTGQTAATFTLDTSGLADGVHTVTVICVKNGVPYSAEATVTK